MTDLAQIQPLLEQAQASIVELEAGRIVAIPGQVPAAVAILVRGLEIVSRELQSEVALLGTLLHEAEVLMDRFEAAARRTPESKP